MNILVNIHVTNRTILRYWILEDFLVALRPLVTPPRYLYHVINTRTGRVISCSRFVDQQLVQYTAASHFYCTFITLWSGIRGANLHVGCADV